MNYNELIIDFVDGNLDPNAEEGLFFQLSVNEDLRVKLKQLLAVDNTIYKNVNKFEPEPNLTAGVFSALGFGIVPEIPANLNVPVKKSFNFANILKTNLKSILSGFVGAVVTSVIFTSYVIPERESDITQNIQPIVITSNTSEKPVPIMQNFDNDIAANAAAAGYTMDFNLGTYKNYQGQQSNSNYQGQHSNSNYQAQQSNSNYQGQLNNSNNQEQQNSRYYRNNKTGRVTAGTNSRTNKPGRSNFNNDDESLSNNTTNSETNVRDQETEDGADNKVIASNDNLPETKFAASNEIATLGMASINFPNFTPAQSNQNIAMFNPVQPGLLNVFLNTAGEIGLMIEINGLSDFQDLPEKVNPLARALNNTSVTLGYEVIDGLYSGLNYARESFCQRFNGIDNGREAEWEQQPNFETWSIFVRYYPIEDFIVLPYLQLSCGLAVTEKSGNSSLPVARASLGFEYGIFDNLFIYTSIDYSHLSYYYQDLPNSSSKIDLNYGIKFTF